MLNIRQSLHMISRSNKLESYLLFNIYSQNNTHVNLIILITRDINYLEKKLIKRGVEEGFHIIVDAKKIGVLLVVVHNLRSSCHVKSDFNYG